MEIEQHYLVQIFTKLKLSIGPDLERPKVD
jgi:hypothetical protein